MGSDLSRLTQVFKAELLLPLILNFPIQRRNQNTSMDKRMILVIIMEVNYGHGQSLLGIDCPP